MKSENVKRIKSVDRAIQLIKCFEKKEELGVTEISRMMGLHKSTTFGMASTLAANGILEKNDNTGKYRLGLELYRLGNIVNHSIRQMVVPYLEKLVNIYQETANLVIIQNLSVIYLEKVESAHSIRIATMVGSGKPLYCTAVGKAILAYLPSGKLEYIIENIRFIKYTSNTIDNKEKLMKALNDIKKKGYAEDCEEMENGLTCVATPIFNQYGIPFAAISLSGPTSRMKEDIRKQIGATLYEYTKEISRKIGFVQS